MYCHSVKLNVEGERKREKYGRERERKRKERRQRGERERECREGEKHGNMPITFHAF